MKKLAWPALWLCALLLGACSGPRAPAEPTVPPAQVPQVVRPTIPPLPTAAPSGPRLEGRLVFSAGGNLWLWKSDGGQKLTQSGDAYQPAWAPDGQRLVFVRRSESASDLVMLSLEGGESSQLTSYTPDLPPGSADRVYSSIWALYPAWSPDGQEIAFVSQYAPPYGSPASDYRLGLYGMPPEPGADRSMYYTDQSAQVGRLAYSPDGSGIFFALLPDEPGIPRIYRYDRLSGEAGELPGVSDQSYDPAISPDGRMLAFAQRHDGETDIYLLMLDRASTPIQVTHGGAARAPAFSPDGTQLAFLANGLGERGFDLWVTELRPGADGVPDVGEPERMTVDMGIDADSGVTWGR